MKQPVCNFEMNQFLKVKRSKIEGIFNSYFNDLIIVGFWSPSNISSIKAKFEDVQIVKEIKCQVCGFTFVFDEHGKTPGLLVVHSKNCEKHCNRKNSGR